MFLHFDPHFEAKKHQKTTSKFDKKKHSNFYGNGTYSQRSRGRPAGYAIAARELRKDQNQEFFRISQKNLNTASAWGAPDSIASRILPCLGLAFWHLDDLVSVRLGRARRMPCLDGLVCLAGLACLVI